MPTTNKTAADPFFIFGVTADIFFGDTFNKLVKLMNTNIKTDMTIPAIAKLEKPATKPPLAKLAKNNPPSIGIVHPEPAKDWDTISRIYFYYIQLLYTIILKGNSG